MDGNSGMALRVFTIGHSNQTTGQFIDLLRRFSVQAIADTRSLPKSRYATQFDREPLQQALSEIGIRYVYLGRELGGRPRGAEFYDSAGHVLYDRVAASGPFRSGIERLHQGLGQFNLALLCAEEDPTGCHRRLLVGRVLRDMGVDLLHIRADGRLQTEADLVAAENKGDTDQLCLFSDQEPDEWKSIPSVSPKKRLRSFSAL
jgi:uncharacterized protein (DUF488 family)